jgi:O-antigen ligase
MNAAELKNILWFESNKQSIFSASILIIIISVIFAVILGFKALIVPAALALIWAAIISQMNLLWIFLVLNPIMMYYSVTVANATAYIFAAVFIIIWLSGSLMTGFDKLHISREITWLMISLLFIDLISILPGGFTKNEIYTYIRILILFAFITAYYDLLLPKDTIKFFVALSIPLLLNGFEIFRVFFSVNNIFDFLILMRMKVGGMFQNANSAGFMFLLGAPFWIALMLWHEKRIIKIWSAFVSFIMLAGLVLTNARASIVGILVSIFFFAFWKRKLRYYFGIVLLALVIIFGSPAIRELFSAAARVDRGLTSRDVIWRNTMEIIKANLPFGVGLGNYTRSYSPYLVLAWDKGFVKYIPHAHNLILSKTADMGIPGLVWVIFIYILPLKTGYYLLKRTTTNRDKAIIYGIMATFFGMYTQSLFETGGLLGEARFTPDVYYWILFASLLKAKSIFDPIKEEIFV